jgi:hypothetical protein
MSMTGESGYRDFIAFHIAGGLILVIAVIVFGFAQLQRP